MVHALAESAYFFRGNQLLNNSRAGVHVVNSETFASASLSINIMFASGQVSVRYVGVYHANGR